MVAITQAPGPALSAGSGINAVAAPPREPASAQAAPKVNLEVPKKAEINFSTEKMVETMREAVARLNEMMKDSGRGLNFNMDPVLGRPVVTVKNTDTGEVVRTIPNEVVIRVAHSIEEFKGLLHDSLQ